MVILKFNSAVLLSLLGNSFFSIAQLYWAILKNIDPKEAYWAYTGNYTQSCQSNVDNQGVHDSILPLGSIWCNSDPREYGMLLLAAIVRGCLWNINSEMTAND